MFWTPRVVVHGVAPCPVSVSHVKRGDSKGCGWYCTDLGSEVPVSDAMEETMASLGPHHPKCEYPDRICACREFWSSENEVLRQALEDIESLECVREDDPRSNTDQMIARARGALERVTKPEPQKR